jgi:hypothetical protein
MRTIYGLLGPDVRTLIGVYIGIKHPYVNVALPQKRAVSQSYERGAPYKYL